MVSTRFAHLSVASSTHFGPSITCRARRVKCDESKPTCRNCSKKNRPCQYPNSNSISLDAVGNGGARQEEYRNNSSSREERTDHRSNEQLAVQAPHDQAPVVELISNSDLVDCNATGDSDRTLSVGDAELGDVPALLRGHELSTARLPTREEPTYQVANLSTILQYANLRDQIRSPIDNSNGPDPSSITLASHHRDDQDVRSEKQPKLTAFRLDEPLCVSIDELPVFRNYVDRISKWVRSCPAGFFCCPLTRTTFPGRFIFA